MAGRPGNWTELRGILQEEMPASEKLVLLALRIRQGENATCWPCQDTLAADTGLTKRSVRTITAKLESRGCIAIGRRSRDGRLKEYTVIRGNDFPHLTVAAVPQQIAETASLAGGNHFPKGGNQRPK